MGKSHAACWGGHSHGFIACLHGKAMNFLCYPLVGIVVEVHAVGVPAVQETVVRIHGQRSLLESCE